MSFNTLARSPLVWVLDGFLLRFGHNFVETVSVVNSDKCAMMFSVWRGQAKLIAFQFLCLCLFESYFSPTEMLTSSVCLSRFSCSLTAGGDYTTPWRNKRRRIQVLFMWRWVRSILKKKQQPVKPLSVFRAVPQSGKAFCFGFFFNDLEITRLK